MTAWSPRSRPPAAFAPGRTSPTPALERAILLLVLSLGGALGACLAIDPDTLVPRLDRDDDGFTDLAEDGSIYDCDDTSAAIHPGADEVCDGLDNDCSGGVDEGFEGATGSPCVDDDLDGTSEEEGDCDDADASRHPEAGEVCDGRDDNCSGGPDGQGDFYVSVEEPSDGPSIQAAIEIAGDGCLVLVAPGTYPERIDFKGRNLHLLAQDGPEATVIDAGKAGTAVTFAGGEDRGAILEGFTLTNGTGTALQLCCPVGLAYGGAIVIEASSPTIRSCVLSGNTANRGGAVFVHTGNPLLEDNLFTGNSSSDQGSALFFYQTIAGEIRSNRFEGNRTSGNGGSPQGAVSIQQCTNVVVSGNTFEGNLAQSAGALLIAGSDAIEVSDNVFTANEAEEFGGAIGVSSDTEATLEGNLFQANVAGKTGGAVYCSTDSKTVATLTVIGNRFEANQAEEGAGLRFYGTCGGSVQQNLFVENDAGEEGVGAGIGLEGISTGSIVSLRIHNNLFHDNEAGFGAGLSCRQDADTVWIYNNTFSDNRAFEAGGGMYLEKGSPLVENNLITFNTGDFGLAFGDPDPDPSRIRYNDFSGNEGDTITLIELIGSTGNVSVDPQYLDREGRDYHLGPESPVKDKGNPASDRDVDGSLNDMGAYGGPEGDW